MNGQLSSTLVGVEEYSEGYAVELVRQGATHGRLSIRARNEGGNNETLVDLWGLLDYLRFGPESGRVDAGFRLPVAESNAVDER